jgi:hypoxanthine phosphoribosyltransferase
MSRVTIDQAGNVTVHDKVFEPMISLDEIRDAVSQIASRISADYSGKTPICVVVLNGAFIFAADLMRAMQVSPEIAFIRVSSYVDTASTGTVREVLGMTEEIAGRDVIVIEDIVDTGHTIAYLENYFRSQGAAGIAFATLLFKEEAYQYDIPIDYVGIRIPNRFVVGCGLDYNGLGRALDCIYVLKE